MFINGPVKTANYTTTLLNKCCWNMLRRSLTIFESQSKNNFRLCRNSHIIRNGSNYEENVKKQKRFIGNILKRSYSNGSIGGNFTIEREEMSSLVVSNKKTQIMKSLQDEYWLPHNINELLYYYMSQKVNSLNNIPIYLHLKLLTYLYEKKEIEKVLMIIKYLRGRENIVKWFNNNLIILECIIKLNIKEAIKKFNLLNKLKGNLSINTINNLMKLLIKNNEITTAEELLGKFGKDYYHVELYNNMLNVYVKKKKLEKTLYLLEMMKRNGIKPNVKSYNLLLNLFGKLRAQNDAEQTFNDMLIFGLEPDHSTYCNIILSCANNKDIKKCFYYFNHMIRKKIDPTIYHYSILMSACVKSGNFNLAIKLFNRMVYYSNIKPNTIILTTLMCAVSNNNNNNNNNHNNNHNNLNIDHIFNDIRNFDIPDLIAYTTLINAKAKQLKLEEAIIIYQQMLRDNIKPNVYTYTTLIDACAKLRNLKMALKLFDDMKRKDIIPNQFTYCAIMNAFINNGQLSNAFKIFDEMKKNGLKPDVVCFNCLMDACNRSGLMNLLFELYSDLIEKYNLIPDNCTVSIYIDACTYNNHFNFGKHFYTDLIKNKYPFSFIKLNNQNFLSIINLFGKNGYTSEIVKVLKIMKQQLIRPNRIIRLVIFNYLYELNKRKELEVVNRILYDWTSIPTKSDLIKFRRNYRWYK